MLQHSEHGIRDSMREEDGRTKLGRSLYGHEKEFGFCSKLCSEQEAITKLYLKGMSQSD